MKRICFLIVYIPLQEFFLKLLPLSDELYFLARQLPDLIVVALFLEIAACRLLAGGRLPSLGGPGYFLAAFLGWALIQPLILSLFDHHVGASNVIEVFVLLRFTLLLYIMVWLRPTERQVTFILRLVFISLYIQLALGVAQALGGIAVRDFLAARNYTNTLTGFEKSFTGARVEGLNDIAGSFGDTIGYAYFLLIGLFLYIRVPRRFPKSIVVGSLALVLIYLSGSKTVFLVGLVGVLLFAMRHARLPVRFYVFGCVMPALVAILPFVAAALDQGEYEYSSITALFRRETIQVLLNQRLGLVVFFLPELVASGDVILGLGADRVAIMDVVAQEYPSVPYVLLAVFDQIFEDLYWLALLAYYGVIGLLTFAMFLYSSYRKALPEFPVSSGLHNSIIAILPYLFWSTVAFNFLNQCLEVRGFSFYYWLILGISISLTKDARRSLLPG